MVNKAESANKQLNRIADEIVNYNRLQEEGYDLDKCPVCKGIADNGHDRCLPPAPYLCTKCEKKLDKIIEKKYEM